MLLRGVTRPPFVFLHAPILAAATTVAAIAADGGCAVEGAAQGQHGAFSFACPVPMSLFKLTTLKGEAA